jgi:hypothetical protein
MAPGEILLEEFLKPLALGQVEAARRLEISLNRLNEIVDASPGRLGSASSRGSGRQGVLTGLGPRDEPRTIACRRGVDIEG